MGGYNFSASGGKAILIELLLLAAGLVLVTPPAVYLNLAWLAASLLLISFAMRAKRTDQLLPPTGLNLPWILFILSAAWGAWISVDHDMALVQFVRLLAAYVVFCALVSVGYHRKRGMAWFLLGSMALLAVYWPVSYPFMSSPEKFSLISRVGALINSLLPISLKPGIPANMAGGVAGAGCAIRCSSGVDILAQEAP